MNSFLNVFFQQKSVTLWHHELDNLRSGSVYLKEQCCFKSQTLPFLNARVDQIVGKGPKAEGEAAEDQSMMGRLVKVEKQVRIFCQVYESPMSLFPLRSNQFSYF